MKEQDLKIFRQKLLTLRKAQGQMLEEIDSFLELTSPSENGQDENRKRQNLKINRVHNYKSEILSRRTGKRRNQKIN